MILSRVLAWLREEPNKGDFTKGKIKYGKDAITLGSDERSATPADKLRTRKKKGSQHPDFVGLSL